MMFIVLALQAELLDHDDPAVRADAEARYLRLDRELREAAAGVLAKALLDLLGAPPPAPSRKEVEGPFEHATPGFELQGVERIDHGRIRLELYAVQDFEDVESLADEIRRELRVVPQFQNGVLILRATKAKQAQVRSYLAARRAGVAWSRPPQLSETEAVARARAFMAALAELRGAGSTLEGRLRAAALVDRFESTLLDLLTK